VKQASLFSHFPPWIDHITDIINHSIFSQLIVCKEKNS
jgi:hypothetical protein